jgi:hypothetical protein
MFRCLAHGFAAMGCHSSFGYTSSTEDTFDRAADIILKGIVMKIWHQN